MIASQIDAIEKDFSSLVIVGQLGAPFGVKGWHHVRSFTNPIENILRFKKWYVQQKGEWIPFTLVAGRPHGQDIVVHLEGIDDRDLAAHLRLSNVAVFREQLAPLAQDEFYWIDLEGLTVQTTQKEQIGTILYLYHNVSTDIMVVEKEGKEQHIPFVMHDTVINVDLVAKLVTIDWDLA